MTANESFQRLSIFEVLQNEYLLAQVPPLPNLSTLSPDASPETFPQASDHFPTRRRTSQYAREDNIQRGRLRFAQGRLCFAQGEDGTR